MQINFPYTRSDTTHTRNCFDPTCNSLHFLFWHAPRLTPYRLPKHTHGIGIIIEIEICSPILGIGAVAERSRLGPLLVFVFVWSTLVYDPIACWTWNPKGWVFIRGGLDFAGGTPVHITSGTAALAISVYLGKRRGWGTERLAYKPHNSTYVVLGTVFLWFGWFGFNGGSALAATMRAAMACTVTNVSFGCSSPFFLVFSTP